MKATRKLVAAMGLVLMLMTGVSAVGKKVPLDMSKLKIEDIDVVYEIENPSLVKMVKIPGKNYEMLNTEVTQGLYMKVMGENPSYNKGYGLPVESVSWYDAVMFCNRLSVKDGLDPVYAVNGKTDTGRWGYTPHKGNKISGNITQNTSANGYRLPTVEEWQHAARGGQSYTYAGSNDLDAVGWYDGNSGDRTHEVGKKKANGYGLYDMSGNVWEWCWDADYSDYYRCHCGGSYDGNGYNCEVGFRGDGSADYQHYDRGFRILRSSK